VIVHRWTGLALAFFLCVAGLTGSVIAFYDELDAWLNPTLLTVPQRSGAPLGLDQLARKAEAAIPNSVVTSIQFPKAPGQAISLGVEGRIDVKTGAVKELVVNEAYLDPFDGRFLGARSLGEFGLEAPRIMSFIYSVHYSLHLPGMWGWWVMGIVAIVWFFDNFVGAYLTFPSRRRANPNRPPQVAARLARGWWSRWKPAWLIKSGGSPFRITFDLHRAFGLWLWMLLGMLALTSVYLNLPREVFNPIVNLFATIVPEPEEFPGLTPGGDSLSFEAALATARKGLPQSATDLQPKFIIHDREQGTYHVGFGHPNARDEWFRVRHEDIYLDAASGAAVGRSGTESGGAGNRFNAVLFPLHSGHLLALPGRIIICVTGIFICVISVTGVLIWMRKRKAAFRHNAMTRRPRR
jgi:uncharacterized iron-regulated membrane protein